MAIFQRQPEAVIHHSDQGAVTNAMCESFFARLECERLNRRSYRTQAEARMSVFQYIEGWSNPHRRHLALGYFSPINFEKTSSAVALAAD